MGANGLLLSYPLSPSYSLVLHGRHNTLWMQAVFLFMGRTPGCCRFPCTGVWRSVLWLWWCLYPRCCNAKPQTWSGTSWSSGLYGTCGSPLQDLWLHIRNRVNVLNVSHQVAVFLPQSPSTVPAGTLSRVLLIILSCHFIFPSKNSTLDTEPSTEYSFSVGCIKLIYHK